MFCFSKSSLRAEAAGWGWEQAEEGRAVRVYWSYLSEASGRVGAASRVCFSGSWTRMDKGQGLGSPRPQTLYLLKTGGE